MLVGPSAAEFRYLLDAVRLRSSQPLPGAPPRPSVDELTPPELACAAILLNYSNRVITEITTRWLFRSPGIRPRVLCRMVILGYSGSAQRHPAVRYWSVILPGSVRLLTRERIFGDNRDVRPPAPEELYEGTWVGGAETPLMPMDAETVELSLDAVLFEDGDLAGDDQCGLRARLNLGRSLPPDDLG